MTWTPERVAEFKSAYLEFERHVVVDSKEGGRICLGDQIYESQKRLLDGIGDGLVAGIHDVKVLKSRQLGISTRARAIGIFWLGLFDGLKGAMIFDTGPNKDYAHQELVQMIEGLPASVDFPRIKRNNRDMLVLANGSTVQFRAAGSRASRGSKALGTSLGINLLIASEMLNWQDQEGVISLQQALAKEYENRLFVWESTARGYEGIWYDMWNDAVADEEGQKTVFVGWWSHPLQRFERDSRRFARYGSEPPTEREKRRIDAVRAAYAWEVTQEQLAWYRWYIDPARQPEDEEEAQEDNRKTQEQPWTESEAFQLTGNNFFEPGVLSRRMEVAAREPAQSRWTYYPGADFLGTEFASARSRQSQHLTVWEEPLPGAAYVVAGDVAFGHDERNDRSVAQVLRCYADGVDQVAEFVSASTPTHQFAWLILALCGWYAQNGAGIVAEIVEINGPGDAVMREMDNVRKAVMRGHLSMAARSKGLRDIFNNVRQYMYKRSDAALPGSNREWKTTGPLKVSIMERLRDEIHRGRFLARSPELLREMATIVRDGDSIAAGGSAKDDRVITCAIGLRAWEDRLLALLEARRMTREADRARVQLSPEARWRLFSAYQIDAMFAGKSRNRLAQAAQEARAKWRYR